MAEVPPQAPPAQEAPKTEKTRGFGRPTDKKGGKRPERKKEEI